MAATVSVQQSSDQGVIQQAAKRRERYLRSWLARAVELQLSVVHFQLGPLFSPFDAAALQKKF